MGPSVEIYRALIDHHRIQNLISMVKRQRDFSRNVLANPSSRDAAGTSYRSHHEQLKSTDNKSKNASKTITLHQEPISEQTNPSLNSNRNIPPTIVTTGPAHSALQNYQLQSQWLHNIPDAPVYRPTVDEWSNPIRYITKIQQDAALYGICVIEPPVQAVIPAHFQLQDFKFIARIQDVKTQAYGAEWGSNNTFWWNKKTYSIPTFQAMADKFAKKQFGTTMPLPVSFIEASYWTERENGDSMYVQYGNDLEGTGFFDTDPLGQTSWNLNVGCLSGDK